MMVDEDTFDWNGDWVPPRPVYMDDLLIVDPVLGKVPFWKSLIYNSAKLRNAVEHRADALIGPEVSPLTAEQQPPPLAADAEGIRSRARLSDEELKQIEDAVDLLDQRLTALEARRDAEQGLIDLEEALEATGIAPEEEQRDVKLN
jgi:hypothetical protein